MLVVVVVIRLIVLLERALGPRGPVRLGEVALPVLDGGPVPRDFLRVVPVAAAVASSSQHERLLRHLHLGHELLLLLLKALEGGGVGLTRAASTRGGEVGLLQEVDLKLFL